MNANSAQHPQDHAARAAMSETTKPEFRYTIFPDVHANTKREYRGWTGLCTMLLEPPTHKRKDQCPLIKLATFGDIKTPAGSLRHNANMVAVHGVEGDYDGGQVTVEETVKRLRRHGIEALVYTTPSHTDAAPRWRVLAPLSRLVSPAERAGLVARLDVALGGILAAESHTQSQAFYFGRVGSNYEAKQIAGAFIDQAEVVGAPPPVALPGSSAAVATPIPAPSPQQDSNEIARDFEQIERQGAIGKVTEETLQDLQSALAKVSAFDRNTWIAVGQALASLKGTMWEAEVKAMWITWSATASSHNPQTDPATWDNLKGDRSDYRAVFNKAKENGWDPRQRAKTSRSTTPATHTPAAPASSKREKSRSTRGNEAAAVEVLLIRGSDLKPEAIRWVWPQWLARGKLHLLGGKPGQGKTTLALALATSATSGGRWPDGTRAEPTNVLIWSGEDDPKDTLVPRLRAMGADMSRVHFVDGVMEGDRRPFDPATDVVLLLEAVRKVGDVGMVIVDPIVSVVTGDSHHNAEVRRALQPLVDLGMALDAAVLGITHLSKSTKGQDPIDRVIGSVAFSAVARVIFIATKDQSGAAGADGRILVRAKSNIGPDGDGFGYALRQEELAAYPGVTGSCVLWGASIKGDARQLLERAEGSQDQDENDARSASRDAADLMQELLAAGEMDSREVKEYLLARGFTDKQIRTARERHLKVEMRRAGYGPESCMYWSLPASPRPSGAQSGPTGEDDLDGHGWPEDGQSRALPMASVKEVATGHEWPVGTGQPADLRHLPTGEHSDALPKASVEVVTAGHECPDDGDQPADFQHLLM
ncbi:MAG: AAA family ATPase [Rubrivivax sp.]|nr:AAA family ATPase [Rubrivivax sp.]